MTSPTPLHEDDKDQLQSRLELTLQRQALAARAGKVGVWDWDISSDTFHIDPHLLSMLGYEDASPSMTLQDYSAHVHPEDVENVTEQVRRCVRTGEGDLSLMHRKLHRDGTTRWFLSRGKVQRDADGTVCRLIGTDTDITELKVAQDALEQAKAALEEHVAERTTQLQRANRRLRVQMGAREQYDSHREAVFQLRQRVWRMESPSDMATVLEAVEASLDIAGVDYEQYGINLVVDGPDGQGIHQSLKTSQGEWAYHSATLAKPERLLRFVKDGRIVYRKDLKNEDPYGDSSWAMQPTKQYRSVIDVPFAYGTLALNSFDPGAFDDAQVELLSDLAEVLAEAFQRAQDLQDLADRNHQLEQQLAQVREREEEVQNANARLAAKDLLLGALHEITTAVHEEAEEDSVLDRFTNQLFEMGVLRSLVLAVVDDEHRVVRIASSLWRRKRADGGWETVGTALQKLGVEYSIDDENVTAEAARTGKLIVIEGWDDRYDKRFETPESSQGKVAYFLPIAYLGKVTAVLCTGSYVHDRQEMLQVLADLQPVFDHFAIALHHARLYRLIAERERQLRMAQKMDEMGQLTSGIAHNFNNLLQGVIGNLSLVLEECDESMRAPLEDALRSSRSQAELVRQLMAYARRGPEPELAPVGVEQLLDSVTSLCRQIFDRGIEFRSSVAPQLPPVIGDITQLEQVLLNLCLNARDAVEAQRERTPRIEVTADLQTGVKPDGGDVVRLVVRDNGVGMSSEVRERVFDPFFTTKEPGKGTGLGLSIVHGIVQQHGGRVECESEPGNGTAMILHLPVSDHALIGESNDVKMDQGGHERILLVEDEPMVRDVVGRILRRHGYAVAMAVNGADGLEQLAASDPDLVLLDLSMPVMSGEGMLESLAATNPDLPVIVFTGFGDLRHRTGQVAALLPKPVRPSELLRTIRRALDG